MWLDTYKSNNCPVCLCSLIGIIKDPMTGINKKMCTTYHYMASLDASGHAASHTIYLSGDYVVWETPRGAQKRCVLNWNNKRQKIDWLELESPLDLEALKIRINKLLWFL
jgi:hypothetical protein